ncbi:sporulation protein [Brevibacillus fulvus]|uniref:Sporulation-control protein n=1 Tax=Brevibacillus fulvus TaxID=1125967 RepID=A0A939BTR8_9BACL|nr:sporulation protein [Brevibacillus fulvus]MBM7592097.1 sporulation-control protein [Brevibacillus fulvus]
MFKKIMAKFGVGAATVDLRLDRMAYHIGDQVTGVIHIEGGSVEQRISDLSVVLLMKAYIRGREEQRAVATIPVLRGFMVQPKPYVQDIPFTYTLPAGLAVSTPSIQYFLQTKLDVEMAMDPTDLDSLQILPPAHIDKVFQALARHDFRQKPDSGRLTPYGQAFSFFPGKPLGAPLNGLEIIFYEAPGELRLLTHLDIPQTGFFGNRDQRAEIVVSHDLLEDGKEADLEQFLMEKLQTYVQNPASIPYVPMQTYAGARQAGGHGIGGMLGGMAAGLLGGMLLGELMSEFGDNAADMFGEDQQVDAEAEDTDGGFDDFGDFGDFGDL